LEAGGLFLRQLSQKEMQTARKTDNSENIRFKSEKSRNSHKISSFGYIYPFFFQKTVV